MASSDMSDDEADFEWTCGNNTKISHKRHIDNGAVGEVHEVSPHMVEL